MAGKDLCPQLKLARDTSLGFPFSNNILRLHSPSGKGEKNLTVHILGMDFKCGCQSLHWEKQVLVALTLYLWDPASFMGVISDLGGLPKVLLRSKLPEGPVLLVLSIKPGH